MPAIGIQGRHDRHIQIPASRGLNRHDNLAAPLILLAQQAQERFLDALAVHRGDGGRELNEPELLGHRLAAETRQRAFRRDHGELAGKAFREQLRIRSPDWHRSNESEDQQPEAELAKRAHALAAAYFDFAAGLDSDFAAAGLLSPPLLLAVEVADESFLAACL